MGTTTTVYVVRFGNALAVFDKQIDAEKYCFFYQIPYRAINPVEVLADPSVF